MSLTERFANAPEPERAARRARSATMNGFETGVRLDERDGSTVATTPDLLDRLADEDAWREAVEKLGISVPDGYAVQLIEMRHDPAAWHRDEETSKAVTRPVWRYRFRVQPASPRVNVEDLLERVREARVTSSASPDMSDNSVFVFALGDTQFGKALSDDTPILTTTGWTKHGELRPGDYVYGPDGAPKRVLAVTGSTVQELFDVEFDKGVVLQATGDHRWTGTRMYHPAQHRQVATSWEWRDVTLTTSELAALQNSPRKLHVELPQPLQLAEQQLLIDPYVLGLWLGDGNRCTGVICADAADQSNLQQYGHVQPSSLRDNGFATVRVPGLTAQLRELDLLQNKHVPEQYLNSSADQRLALLQGLMDSDGSCASNGTAEFVNTNLRLTDAVEWLLTSLGVKYTRTERVGKFNGIEHLPFVRLSFFTRPDLPVFRLERKLVRCSDGTSSQFRQTLHRQVKSVMPAGYGSAQCITVEGSLYLAGRELVVTHNCDGDGVEGTLQRVLDSTDRAVQRLEDLRSLGHRPKAVYLTWLGDCIEGFQSQGGNNAWRTPMTLTEQVRLVRRVMLEQVNLFRERTEQLCLLSVPGNHDEAHRFNGKGITRYDDSWAVEAAVAVHDAMEVNPTAYDHVAVQVPGRDELTLTLDLAGTVTGFSHGHQARAGKMMDWWAGQAHGMQPIGEASLLLTAHLHHLRLEQSGAKTWLQVPALEGDSAWWRHRTGQKAPPGAVTMLVGQGGWSDLSIV